MYRQTLKQLHDDQETIVGHPVTVAGWITTSRTPSAKFSFVMLNDGTHMKDLQLIVPSTLHDYKKVSKGSVGVSIMAIGQLVKSRGQGQEVELKVDNMEVFGACDPHTYPLAKKSHTLEYLRSDKVLHLRIRTKLFQAITRIRTGLSFATHEYFTSRNFQYLHAPLITTSDCEGAGEMFRVSEGVSQEFFKKPAFLTVSGQLQGEAYATAMSKIYTFGPTFRAEKSNTTRHLAEFWMIEPEVAFADLIENMQLAEDYVTFMIQYVLKKYPNEIDFLQKYEARDEKRPAWKKVPLKKRLTRINDCDGFSTITYEQAMKIINSAVDEGHVFEGLPEGQDQTLVWGDDLCSARERYLCEEVFKSPVIVYNYPKELKPFYMYLNDDGKTVRAMDVLVPGIGELIGGSQREHRLDVFDRRLVEKKMDPEAFAWFRSLREFGTVPHSGFGLGFERMVCLVTGMQNIKDVIPYPRSYQNCLY